MLERYDVDDYCIYPLSYGNYLLVDEVIKYFESLLKYYDEKNLVYRADTIRKILKDIPK